MSEEFDLIFKVFDNLGAFGVLVFFLAAMYRGWLVPKVHVEQLLSGQHEIIDLQKQQITKLEEAIERQKVRTEQGVHLISAYIEAQDNLAKIADHLGTKGDQNE